MKFSFLLSLLLAFLTTSAWSSSTTLKQADNIQNSSGGAAIAVPSTGTSFATDSNTLTLTNKTLSGASNTFSNIPGSAISSGQVSVANGGTGVGTFTLNGILFGNGTSSLQVTSAGSQYQLLQAGSGGVPTFGALQLGQSAAVSGQLGVANGGTGQSSLSAHELVVGNGTSAVNQVSPGTAGYVLTSNGSSADPTFQAVPSAAPALNGGSGSVHSVTASGGVSLSGISYVNYIWIKGSSGPVTVTATPSVSACTGDGQELYIVGAD